MPVLIVLGLALSAAEERAVVFNHCGGMDPVSRRCEFGNRTIIVLLSVSKLEGAVHRHGKAGFREQGSEFAFSAKYPW